MTDYKKYCKQVKKWLPCGGPLKKQLMESISATLEDYLLDNPNATFQQLQDRFGSPQQIAASYIDEMDTQQLLNALYIRRRIITIILTVAIATLIIFALCMTAIYFEAISSFNGYYEVDII